MHQNRIEPQYESNMIHVQSCYMLHRSQLEVSQREEKEEEGRGLYVGTMHYTTSYVVYRIKYQRIDTLCTIL